MTNPTPDPVALEDRLEAVKAWILTRRKHARDACQDDVVEQADLHLATLDDAIEALIVSREPSLSITGGRVAAPSEGWQKATIETLRTPSISMIMAGEQAAFEAQRVDRKSAENWGEAPNISSTPKMVWEAMFACAVGEIPPSKPA